MKTLFFIFLLLLSFAFSISAQTNEERLIDEFSYLDCGNFMMRMHWIFLKSQESPDSKIYVIYYGGGSLRKRNLWNKKTKSLDKFQLEYPHREDGLNWAKAIPLFLTTTAEYSEEIRNSFKDRIVLINGGYQENIITEIWLVPKNVETPKPTPTIDEKDIKFRKDKPLKTPKYMDCYGQYN